MPKAVLKKAKKTDKITRTLTLVLTKDCNLRCLYCYEKHKNRESEIMDFQVAKNAITSFLSQEDDNYNYVIEFFGGEPLLAFPLIQKIFNWCQAQNWKHRIHFLLGTNGTLLNDEIKEWFARNHKYFSITYSLDGNRTAHNISRDNSYDLLYPHFDFFLKYWPEQPAKMTITAETIPFVADSIIEMEEMGLYFSANIVFEDIWGNEESKQKLLKVYEEQLMRLVEYYVENTHLEPVTPMLGTFPSYLGIQGYAGQSNNTNDCVRYCGAGHEMRVADIDGKVYPCHRFLPWVTERPKPTSEINRQVEWKPDKCTTCKIVDSCPTCVGFNWEINGDTGIRTTYHCEAHKLEVRSAAEIVAKRLQKIQLSKLEAMQPEMRGYILEKVETVLELINNGF